MEVVEARAGERVRWEKEVGKRDVFPLGLIFGLASAAAPEAPCDRNSLPKQSLNVNTCSHGDVLSIPTRHSDDGAAGRDERERDWDKLSRGVMMWLVGRACELGYPSL